MRTINDTLINAPSVISGTWQSEALFVGRTSTYSIQIGFNTATAIVKLQCSTDRGNPEATRPEDYKVVNWTDVEESETALNASGLGVFDVSDVGYNWVRVVVIGNANLDTLRFNAKGW
jgi:hypothetical protein